MDDMSGGEDKTLRHNIRQDGSVSAASPSAHPSLDSPVYGY
jgi:hypothetical protein